ncbi:MAG: glycosyltransferase family 4 protein [Chloroflexales bacterium]
MRILQITPHYYPQRGGVERHVQSISEGLVAHGHDVVVITMAMPGAVAAERINAVPVYRLQAVGPTSAYHMPLGLADCLVNCPNFDIIHVHNYHAAMLPIAAALVPGRLVITPHLNDRPHSRIAGLLHMPYSVVGRWSLRRARAIVCVSAAERARLLSRFGLQPERITVIPNGVDLAGASGAHAVQRDPNLLLAVGRLQAYKGVDRAIAALTRLPAAYRLVVVGEGPCRADLQAHAERLGVAGRVTFVGAVSDDQLAGWYRRASVMLAMSSAEAFGITVIEALAQGCQAVCHDIPAFRDLAAHLPAHISIVSGDSAEAVAAATLKAAHSPAAAADLAPFSWSRIVERLITLYAEVANQDSFGSRADLLNSRIGIRA